MKLLLAFFFLVIVGLVDADLKILKTPDGRDGPQSCVRVCSGVDTMYGEWNDSINNPGKVWKHISVSDCDFKSKPVVTAVSGGGVEDTKLCPSFTVPYVQNSFFKLYSVSGINAELMLQNQCRVYWTATGFTC